MAWMASTLIMAWMASTLAWLVTSRAFYREVVDGQAFKKDNTVRHKRDLRTRQPDIVDLAGELARVDGWDLPGDFKVIALLEARPAFAYDHLKPLSDEDRLQYYHWTATCKVDVADLWFFNVARMTPTPHAVDARAYTRRTVSKTCMKLEPDDAATLAEDVATPALAQMLQNADN